MAEMIEKKALLDDLKGIKEALVGQGDPILASVLNRAIACVEKQPVSDAVAVVHGRWIAVPSSDMVTGKAYKCSECGKMRYGSFKPNYCPNCGAQMDGGADNG